MKYDYLIVGAGLYGSTFAHKATQQGKKCLVIDKRPHAGGNLYCENIEGIRENTNTSTWIKRLNRLFYCFAGLFWVNKNNLVFLYI